jgi:hypothetical protein
MENGKPCTSSFVLLFFLKKKKKKKKPPSAETWLSDLVRLNKKPNRKTQKRIARAALRE